PGRAPAAHQRVARGDEPCGTATPDRGRGRPSGGIRPAQTSPDAGNDGALADPWLGPHPHARDGRDRLPIRRELVALDGREDPPADDSLRALEPGDVGGTSPSGYQC